MICECSTSDGGRKKLYASKAAATAAMRRRGSSRIQVYPCPGGGWHLTRKRSRHERG